MANKIQYADLRNLLENDNTTDDELAQYFIESPSRTPMAPHLRVNEELVDIPKQRGALLDLSVGFLNRWSQRRRLIAYQDKIVHGFTGPRLIAEGDSWFQYPILRKDIIDCLSDEFAIYCTSAAGDTLRNMTTGVDDLVGSIAEHQAHGLLFSGGGNDIAGEALVSYLLPYQPHRVAAVDFLSPAYQRFLDELEIKLSNFFNRLASHHPELPIFCHGYDWPLPQQGGRWLAPAMEQFNIPPQFQAPILRQMINAYYDVLHKVAANVRAQVIIVDCRGLIGERSNWYDELHPFDQGYARLAEQFRQAIHTQIPPSAVALRSAPPPAIKKAPAVPKAPSSAALIDRLTPAPVKTMSQIPEPKLPTFEQEEPRYLDIELISGNIVNVASPAYVMGIFEHVKPGGGVREIDELLGNRLSSLVQAGLFGCKRGEISLLPIPQQRLMSETLVFAGLGSIRSFRPASLKPVAENLARIVTLAKVDQIACIPIGLGSGCTVPEFIDYFLTGFLDGLKAGDPNEDFYSLQICEYDEEKHQAMAEGIAGLIASGFFSNRGYDVHVRYSSVSHQSVVDPLKTRNREDISPFYLEASSPAPGKFEYYLLGKGHGGSITVLNQTIDDTTNAAIKSRLAARDQIDASLGTQLANDFIPPELQRLINKNMTEATNAHLVVLHDKETSAIPWEALYFEGKNPALETGISRIYKTLSNHRNKGQTSLPRDSKLNILIIENPTGDLSSAEMEGNFLLKFFQSLGETVEVLEEKEATRDNIINKIQSRRYDVLHYAGHAHFDETDPGKSGLKCYDDTLVAADMRDIVTPQLIFFNGCESGRMRSDNAEPVPQMVIPRFQANISLAEGLLNNGVPNFIGTYWPVGDETALFFAKQFYTSLLAGEPVGLAMQKGRKATKTTKNNDWANYQHFGDPTYRLRQSHK